MKKTIFTILLIVLVTTIKAQTLTATATENNPGRQWNITITLHGVSTYTAMQANISLPSGVSLTSDTGGTLLTDAHEVICGTLEDGSVSIICYAPDSQVFKLANGTVAILTVEATTPLAQGSYDATLSDIRVSTPQGVEETLANVSLQLVSTYDESLEPTHYEQTPVSSISQLSSYKIYTATTRRGAWYVETGGNQLEATNAPTIVTLNPEDTRQQFAFIKHAENFYIYAVGEKKILNGITQNQPSRGELVTQNCQPVIISETGDENYPLFFAYSNEYNVNINSTGVTIDTWTTQDDGNKVALQEVQGEKLSMTEMSQIISYIQATDINQINDNSTTNNLTLFDLQGRLVLHSKRGIYIQNRRKMIYK